MLWLSNFSAGTRRLFASMAAALSVSQCVGAPEMRRRHPGLSTSLPPDRSMTSEQLLLPQNFAPSAIAPRAYSFGG